VAVIGPAGTPMLLPMVAAAVIVLRPIRNAALRRRGFLQGHS